MEEKIWERIGFAISATVAGLIYSIAFIFAALVFTKNIDVILILKVFVVIFGVSGLIFGQLVFKSIIGSIYVLYFIYGYLRGLALLEPYAISENDIDMFKNKGSAFILLIIGLVSGVVCLFLLYQ